MFSFVVYWLYVTYVSSAVSVIGLIMAVLYVRH